MAMTHRLCNPKRNTTRIAVLCLLAFGMSAPTMATVTTLGYWRLGDNDPGAASGLPGNALTIDISGNGNHLLKSNATDPGSMIYTNNVAVAQVPLTRQPDNLSLTLVNTVGFGASSNAYFYYRTSPISTATDNWGMEAWAMTDNTSTPRSYVVKNGTVGFSGPASGYGITQAGGTYFGLLDGIAVVGGAPAVPGQWVHLALVRDSGITTFYVNGVANGTSAAAVIIPTDGFEIGAAAETNTTGQSLFSGSIDEVRFFTFAPGAFSTSDLLLNPEPSSALLLVLGGLLLWRRSRNRSS